MQHSPSPFDQNRDGTVLSEGAGILILESLERAMKRNAKIYGEIIGFGLTTDAYQMAGASPTGDERARAIETALQFAGISPGDVDYINAHATGTVQNDSNETAVIKRVFGDHAKEIPINATKSMIGHAQGAAGALETIAGLMAFERGIIHPTINYDTPDLNCDLNYVPAHAVEQDVSVMLKTSFAFGGKNSSLLLKAFETNGHH